MKKYISPEIKALIKRKLNKISLKSETEFEKLKRVPRYTKTSAVIDGFKLVIPDSASFLFMYDEIFRTEIYKFKTKNQSPYIIDGGANIGLATIYFKKLFPDAEIVAFEPDSYIYDILESNIKSCAFDTVKLIKKGLWNEETTLKFKSEGADAGLLETINKSDNSNSHDIPVTSLKPYLQKPVDFLKLDIEGAETTVLKDIAEDLENVARIFVEYHSFVGQEQTLNEIIQILKEAGFRLYISSPGISSKSPFVKLTEYCGMDMQLNIYGIKQHK
ncbi:FkbM family methyltransferase [Bizionia sp. M204]|uniref:FkbM family methyltransferase n=1 Tax=Bizionia sp. M204 TaxID=2675331 RepID=UPI0020554E23|nr:FkbM family methyltransferase [Bizionia sp. M204]UPS91684.1 FkbM family methyltransferase [Bizionia sp. M204]